MKYILLAARICFAIFFLQAGINPLVGFSGFIDLIAQKLPLASLFAMSTLIFQFLGSISLIIGCQIRIGVTDSDSISNLRVVGIP